jgi:hypothetical protein
VTRADAWWALALVIAATACGVLAQRLSTTRAITRTELAQLTTLHERVIELETAAAAAAAAAAAPPPVIPTPPPAAPEKPPAPKLSLREARRAFAAAQLKMYADPNARAILRLAGREQQRNENPEVGRALGLSPEEEDRFLDLLAEQQIAQTEAYRRNSDGRGFDQQKFEDGMRAREVDHMAWLGAEKYRRFQHYNETLGDRLRVRQFRSQLDAEDDLTDDTAERLIEVIATARKAQEARQSTPENYRMMFGGPYGITLVVGHDEDGLEKAAAHVEETDRKLAKAVSPLLNASQQRHFAEYLRRSRELALSIAEEHLPKR